MIQFDVVAACIAGTTTAHVCAVTGLQVTGTLGSSISDPSPIIFNFLSNPGPASPPVITLTSTGGVVTGIGTAAIGPTFFNFSPSIFGFAWVDFDLPTVVGGGSMAQLLLQLCPTSTVSAWRSSDSDDDDVCNAGSPTDRSVFTTIRISQVPEPGMAWLLLAALSAGWLVRRRSALH